jgi:hypothetical protein
VVQVGGGVVISPKHLAMLAASGITEPFALARGYETITDPRRLANLVNGKGITRAGRNVPGLLVPMLRVDGSTWGFQYRPHVPRCDSFSKPIKYETPYEQSNGLDFPPGVAPMVGDPSIPLFITEGVKKADCGAINGLCIVGLIGVWNWMHKNSAGGKVALAEWRDVALNGRRVIIAFDSDTARNEGVQKAALALGRYLVTKGARIEYLHLPDTPDKTGLDDYLVSHTVNELMQLVNPVQPRPASSQQQPAQPAPAPKPPPAQPVSLDEAHKTFHRWLGEDYDTDALDAMLAVAAVEKLEDGSDPVWLLIVSGPGAAKTETVQACDGVGAIITSAITGEAALLSATPKRDRAANATGGLLCKIGERGLLVIKDVTSILSMNTDVRGKVLSAMREIYDGRWYREVGAEGGHTLEWKGRLAVVGAVTTAWDTHHSVIATMGDRFTLVRIDSATARIQSGRQAIGNTGDEAAMRAELSAAVAGVIAGMNPNPITVDNTEIDTLLAAADLVTLARTAVVTDYRGDVIDAHAPEMPTRFAKQLTQIVRGGVAIGMDRADALRLAIRCARDSMPPLRLAIIDYLKDWPGNSTQEVRKGINKPRLTVDRQLQALHALGVLTCDERDYGPNGKVRWFYTLAPGIDPSALVIPQSCPGKPPTAHSTHVKGGKGAGVGGKGSKAGSGIPGQPSPGDPSDNGDAFTRLTGTRVTGPGRCPECSWHIPTMGHKPGCQHATERTA